MIELLSRTCGRPFAADRAAQLRGERRCPPCRDADDAPRVPATAAVWSERSGVWSLTVERCPYCHRKRFHGGNDGPEPDLGARLSQCITGEDGTYVVVETDASREARFRRRAKERAA